MGETKIPDPTMVPTMMATPLNSPMRLSMTTLSLIFPTQTVERTDPSLRVQTIFASRAHTEIVDLFYTCESLRDTELVHVAHDFATAGLRDQTEGRDNRNGTVNFISYGYFPVYM